MDFVADLEAVAKEVLDHYGVDYSAAKSGQDFVRMFVNVRSKLIPQVPRNVIKSQKISNAKYDEAIRKALSTVEAKLKKGEDVNPHLSKTILDGAFTDYLLVDWSIHHLHLNTQLDGEYFVKRSGPVLFLRSFADSAYLIDIRTHGRKGEKHVFAQMELLQIIADEWPWILEPHRAKGVMDAEFTTDDPEQIERMRKANIDIPYKINGVIYSAMGGGITISNTATNVVIQTHLLYELAERAMDIVIKERDKIDAMLSQAEGYNPKIASFSFRLGQTGFVIYENTTKSAFRLQC